MGETPLTIVLLYAAGALLVGGFALFVYQLALTPAEVPPDVGIKGLKRQAVIETGGLFNTIEPPMRGLAARIATLPIDDLRESVNAQVRHAGEYLGLSADEYLALCVLSSLCFGIFGFIVDALAPMGGAFILMFAAFGAILVNFGKTWFTGVLPEFWLFALGAVFILVTLFLPKGVLGALDALTARLKRAPKPTAAQPVIAE